MLLLYYIMKGSVVKCITKYNNKLMVYVNQKVYLRLYLYGPEPYNHKSVLID